MAELQTADDAAPLKGYSAGMEVLEGIFSAWGRILAGHTPALSIEITRECPLHCPGCYAYVAKYRVFGIIPVGSIFTGSTRIGEQVRRLMPQNP
jgi:hypothetical protein